MAADPSLRLFAHLAARPEALLDLPRAALLLAEPEYPGLDVAAYLDRIDELGRLARARQFGAGRPSMLGETARPGVPHAVAQLLQLLYGELGFRGDTDDYYDPRNSFLNEVLDRRAGIPITLALVLVEVARRVDLDAKGVGFPGHFLVRFDDVGPVPVFVDPFEGCVLDEGGLAELAERHTGRAAVPDARALEPASKVNTLIRMLNNLRGIYSAKEDLARLRGILERLEVLAPSTELRRQIEALGGAQTPPPRSRPTPLQ
jgi:regulator of sirC expression with transglutaminase-like and TPR domain